MFHVGLPSTDKEYAVVYSEKESTPSAFSSLAKRTKRKQTALEKVEKPK